MIKPKTRAVKRARLPKTIKEAIKNESSNISDDSYRSKLQLDIYKKMGMTAAKEKYNSTKNSGSIDFEEYIERLKSSIKNKTRVNLKEKITIIQKQISNNSDNIYRAKLQLQKFRQNGMTESKKIYNANKNANSVSFEEYVTRLRSDIERLTLENQILNRYINKK
jgi:uncharacterized protein (DUF342 family)